MAQTSRSVATSPGPDEARFSIGDVAEATGISPDMIRVWERRYGRPQAIRLPSGHRRYTAAQVRWLRRVAEALAYGNRASKVVRADDEQLQTLLDEGAGEDVADSAAVQELRALVQDFDAPALVAGLRRAQDASGLRGLLDDTIAPLLRSVGRAWADDELDIRHEHFLTEILEDYLRAARVALPMREDAAPFVLATLPGETHALGLQMLAVLCALHERKTRILGVDVPLEEIGAAVEETEAAAVCVSVSLATGGIETDRKLSELRRILPRHVRLVIGGRGARGVRRGGRGIDYVDGLAGFEKWLQKLEKQEKAK